MSARKLRHYFSAHPIVVVNESPLSNILNNPEATGRVSFWGIELSPRDITYEKKQSSRRFCETSYEKIKASASTTI
jgi:hypothetical protein